MSQELSAKESMLEQEISCSTPGCLEPAFICQCIKHHNELIQKNIAEEKQHEDHILEPIA